MKTTLFAIVVCLGLLGIANAQVGPQKPVDDRPKGTMDSGAITLEQMTNLQRLVSQRYGFVVNYVLPRGWEIVEGGKDRATGKVPEDGKVYVVLSRRPMPDPKEPTDFIFELAMFDHDLLEGVAKDATDEQKRDKLMKNFWDFLNAQLSINNKAGLKTLTQRRDIQIRLYGPEGTRPKTMFVPIAYDVPANKSQGGEGAKLFTFTSITDEKIWMLRFLVSKDQEKNFQSLIALIVNNAFGLSDEQYQELLKNTEAVEKRQKEAASKSKGN